MSYSSDCFEFLSPNLLRFKNRDNLKLTDFIEMILKNPELTIRLPLAVSNKRVYPNLNLEEARALLPRDTKQLIYMTQTHYLIKFKGEAIWHERILGELVHYLAERNISWIELTRKMFAGEFHYPSELNRLYQKIRHYKMEQRMPQSPWVEKDCAGIRFRL